MKLKKVGRGLMGAACLLVLHTTALAQLGGNMQIRYLLNDIDKISRDQPVGNQAVNKQKIDVSGYFTHPDHPGFYGGFYAARELNYKQGFESVGPNDFQNNVTEGSNTVQEFFLGKTYFGDFGELGAELMLGQETQRDGLKYRPKLHGRYEFANGISLYGYGTVLIQTYNGPNQSVAPDREVFETEIQPGIGYKINEHMGIWANYRLRDRTQQRALYGDLNEKERFVEVGMWKNFGQLYTSLRMRSGNFDMWDTVPWEESRRQSTIRKDKINRLVGSVSMPLTDKLRALVDVGYLRESYGIKREEAASELKSPFFVLGLRYEL